MSKDEGRFDDLSKDFARARSRREVVKNVARTLGLALGVGGPIGAVLVSRQGGNAAICRAGGQICTSNGNCCSQVCLPKDSTGRQRCACEAGTTTCGTECCTAGEVCTNGVCRNPAPTPTATLTTCIANGLTCDPANPEACCNLCCASMVGDGGPPFHCCDFCCGG
jgi:hypothetical protein